MSPISSLLSFMGKFGGSAALLDLTDKLNRGMRKEDVARSYKMDPGQFSRFIKDNFCCVYVLRSEQQEFIEQIEADNRERFERFRRGRARIYYLAAPGQTSQKADG
jgi:hypothetical protein